jgi:hypothetical protein
VSLETRLVVAANGPGGRGIAIQDGLPTPTCPAAMPGYEFYVLWGDDATPTLPSSRGVAEIRQRLPVRVVRGSS